MTTLKTFAFTFALLLLGSSASLQAQQTEPDTLRTRQDAAPQRVRGVQYASPQEAAAALAAQKDIPLLAGASIGADVAGAVMAVCSPYGQYEASARLNLKERYFPTVEIGMGVSDHTNETTNLHYKVHSPYYRIGLDYNVMKNRRGGNRIFIGVRYGFSAFKYDVDGPDIHDGTYGTDFPFRYSGMKGAGHWGECLFGIEARVWGILHLGWSVRYKVRFYNRQSAIGSPWYVPGYGKNDTHALGGCFNVIFDI